MVQREAFGVDLVTAKSLDEAVAAVGEALKERQFSVLWDLDIRAKLEEKGLEGAPDFRILEVCSAPRAKEALTVDRRVGYFLPCKVVVYREEEQTHVGLLRPTILISYFDDVRLSNLAQEVEETLTAALKAAVAGG